MDTLDVSLEYTEIKDSELDPELIRDRKHEYSVIPRNDMHKSGHQIHDFTGTPATVLSPLVTPVEKMVAACCGALLTSLFTTPFDLVKTRLQSQSLFKGSTVPNTKSYSSLTSCCQEVFYSTQNAHREFFCHPLDPRIPNQSSTLSCAVADAMIPNKIATGRQFNELNGFLDGVIKIVRYEGITSLWRGLSPGLVMSVPLTVVYFVGYDSIRDSLWKNWKGKYSETYSPLLAGTLARTISVSVISPIELFRTRMQSPEGINGLKDVMKGVKEMVRKNGITSLWRGLEPTLWRDVPFSAIYWTGYESIKRNFSNHLRNKSIDGNINHFSVAFVSGATSGAIAATLTTPFDVAKTRRQVASNSMKNQGIVKAMQRIVHDEGYQGLFRGGALRIAKVAVSCALMISTYESLSKFLAM